MKKSATGAAPEDRTRRAAVTLNSVSSVESEPLCFLEFSENTRRWTLPPEITRGPDVFVRVHGHVVCVDKRRDEDHETIGVAAVIERYEFIRRERIRM